MVSKTSVMYEKGSMVMGRVDDIEGTGKDENVVEELE